MRNGVAEIFLEVEPLAGHRHVAITERRTAKDWAFFIKGMLDERLPAKNLWVKNSLESSQVAAGQAIAYQNGLLQIDI